MKKLIKTWIFHLGIQEKATTPLRFTDAPTLLPRMAWLKKMYCHALESIFVKKKVHNIYDGSLLINTVMNDTQKTSCM